jgi:tetratricopeptide (TPR) repeat protein
MPGRVVRSIPLLFVIVLIAPAPAHAQKQIDAHSLALAEALATYRGGDLRAALARLETIPGEKLTETVSRFCTRDDVRAPLRLVRMRITAALLTEMAFVQIQKNPFAWGGAYILNARALIRRLAQLADAGRDGAGEGERGFARDWYLLVASFHHGRAEVGWSRAYLAEARDLFPRDVAVLVVSGADHEMLSNVSAGYVNRFNTSGQRLGESRINPGRELEDAEKFLRQAVALDPRFLEARLRLGRVLLRNGDLDGALRELRAALAHPDDQIRYLAWTFLGMADVERGDLEAAERCYTEALRLFPAGQIAMLARSEAAYLSGRGGEAAGQVVAMLRIQRKEDPWWMYLLGDWWHFEARLIRLRAEALR